MLQWRFLSLLFLSALIISACELDAGQRVPALIARNTDTPTPTLTSTRTPTVTNTPTLTPTPTVTPTPTPTPIPSDRLAQAQRAYDIGDYETARREFNSLLADPGADPDERRLALYWRGRSELALDDTAAAGATLSMFVRKYPSDELTRAAQFNLARAYEQAAQIDQAITAYRGSIIPDDPINVYIYERIGDLQLQTGAYTDTIASYQAGLTTADEPGFQVHLREGIAQAELGRNDPAAALAQYEAILDIAQIPEYRARILRLAGQAHLADDDPEAAYERYLQAVNSYPEAYDSYLALVELVEAEVPVDNFQRGLVDYHAGAYQPAIAAFESYLESPKPPPPTTPTLASENTLTQTTRLTATENIIPTATDPPAPSSRPAEAVWYIGRSWQALGGYNNAITYFQRLIDAYPDNPHWGQAHIEIGKTLIAQDSISQAKAAFRYFAADNPEHPLAGEALWRAARLELDGDRLEEAYLSLLELAQAYPADEYADEALYWAGRAAFMQKKLHQAIDIWTMLVDTYPNSELASFASYWQAKAWLALDQEDEAKAILARQTDGSLDYYVLRARALLAALSSNPSEGAGSPETVPLTIPTEAELAREQAQAERWLAEWLELDSTQNLAAIGPEIQNDPAFKRGQALLQIGLRQEALAEFDTVEENWWDDPLALYQLSLYFREQGLGELSIVTAARVSFLSPVEDPAEAPIFIQRLLYPIFFEELILAEAEEYDLDPALILALMRQESLFERSAESTAGARGLMQVMPTTGEYVAERGGFGQYHPDQLWLPYLSIKYGAWYLSQQLGMFDNNQLAALAAYNAGPGHVLEWIKVSDDLDVFVESIPFWESRTYIRRIYVNLAAYRRVYGPSAEIATKP